MEYNASKIQLNRKVKKQTSSQLPHKTGKERSGKEGGGETRAIRTYSGGGRFYFESIVYMLEGVFYTEMELLLMFQSCKSGFKVLFTVGTLKGFILRVKNHMLF